jgi:aminoglycoside phosphotransferase family enzyme/predicted kinase
MSQAGLPQQAQLIAALLDPATYPHQAKTVRLIETHISWVLLAGRYAYKIKKALDLGFLDTTALESRQHFCNEEIRLNRRLAPQLYLGVAAIGGSHAHPVWGAHPAIEYAVKMRRFAPAKTFDHLIVRGKVEARHIDALADLLAQFHRALPAASTATGNIHAALAQNFSQLSELLPDTPDLQQLRQASEHAYRNCQQRLADRGAQGYIRECHGDLHLGNIALIANKPVPFDGIDFNPALRHIDVMDEAAFLFMDLLHQQRADLAYRFLNAYLEQTGDYAGAELLSFYCVYRATVRAKVNAIRANQAGMTARAHEEAMAACRSYLQLTAEFLAPQRPRLIITHGLPGSGKSTFAQAALERIGAIRLRSDVERKRLFGLSALQESRAEQNIYSAEATQRTYAHLLATARCLLNEGFTVMVDAAFLKHEEREMFHKLAQETGANFAIASLQADDATLRARILQRQNDASEANLAVLDKLQTEQEPLTQQEMSYTAVFVDISAQQSAWATLAKLMKNSRKISSP